MTLYFGSYQEALDALRKPTEHDQEHEDVCSCAVSFPCRCGRTVHAIGEDLEDPATAMCMACHGMP